MSRSANQIMAAARTLAPTRAEALKADEEMTADTIEMVRRLRAEGVLGSEIAVLFDVASQQVYVWLDRMQGPTKPTAAAAALRVEARALAAKRRKVRAAATNVNARARALAVEVRGCPDLRPGPFTDVLGVSGSQFYRWLDQADRSG